MWAVSAGILTLRRKAWRLRGCRKLGSSAAGGAAAGMSSFSQGGFLRCKLLVLSLRASLMVPGAARRAAAAAASTRGPRGVLRTSRSGCRRRPGGRQRRDPARAPTRPPVRPARRGMPWSEGRARRRRARPEGAAALTQGSGMRAARPSPVTSSGKAAELRSPLCPVARTPVAVGS